MNTKSLINQPQPNSRPVVKTAEKTTQKTVESKPTGNIYQIAWKIVYDRQQEWRKKEINTQLKLEGKLTDSRWDTDFIQQVISEAEKTNVS